MWQCRKCGRPVFFAERKQSLGFDWHPNCLRCEECGKRLNPGQHAEHKGVPYCHHPCYGALFGPQLFGHGTRNECHTSFGKVENRDGQIKRSHLESSLKAYNQFYEGKPGEIRSREVNGRMILEGVLKIYWGVHNVIHLKEEDDQRTIALRRRSTASIPSSSASAASSSATSAAAATDDFYSTDSEEDDYVNGSRTPQSPSSPLTPLPLTPQPLTPTKRRGQEEEEEEVEGREEGGGGGAGVTEDGCSNIDTSTTTTTASTTIDNYNNNTESENGNEVTESTTATTATTPVRRAATKTGSSAIRRRPGRRMNKTKLKRRCSINGHFYLRETSSFTPPHGSPCSVWITSLVTVEEVLNMLLEKYRVEMSTRNFALFVIKDNGERRRIREDEYPLITRVMLGPHEEVARVFIVDAQQTDEISPQVAQFLNLSLAECRAILHQYQQEESRQVLAVRQKYADMAFYIQRRMKELRGV